MGTDIHLLVETRYTYLGRRSAWERVLPPAAYREVPWQVERDEATYETLDPRAAVRWVCSWYEGRNYSLFGMLADVRNGSGFAGVKLGDGFTPISQPKGWPSDPGPEVAAFIAASEDRADYPVPDGDTWPGDHTPSWLTLVELNAYDWELQTSRLCGIIPLAEYARRKAEGITTPPENYSGGIWGNGITVLEQAEADAAMDGEGIVEAEGQRIYVRVWWGETYAEAAGDFYTRVLPGLRSLVRSSGGFITTPDDIRIVFNFDS